MLLGNVLGVGGGRAFWDGLGAGVLGRFEDSVVPEVVAVEKLLVPKSQPEAVSKRISPFPRV